MVLIGELACVFISYPPETVRAPRSYMPRRYLCAYTLSRVLWPFYVMTGDPLLVVMVGTVGLGFVLTLGSYRLDRRTSRWDQRVKGHTSLEIAPRAITS
jgi:hypothetical protein